MENVTFLFSLIGFFAVFFLKPIQGLIVFVIGLCWYPQPLTLSIGTIDLTVTRVIIVALFAKILFRTRLLHEFKWSLMDSFMLAYILGRLIALYQNVPMNVFIEREAGEYFDTILPYFAARLIITSKVNLLKFIKGLVIIAIPLSVLGAYQSITGQNPFNFMFKHFSWGLSELSNVVIRKGLYRANVTFTVHIVFGLFFSGVAVLCLGLWKQRVWRNGTIIIAFIFMLIGLISSMSSGPLLSIMTSLFLLACFPLRKYYIFIAIFLLSSLIFIELYSNRHWYEVPTRMAFSSSTAYYRIDLVKEAFGGGMTGHWISGYGYVGIGPGNDNSNFHWEHKDMVNIYIANIARFGLLGFIPFILINIYYYCRLYLSGLYALTKEDLWLIWCIVSTFGGWNIAMLTVNAFEQLNTLFYILIAISYNMPFIISKGVSTKKIITPIVT